MTTIPDLMQAIGTYMAARNNDDVGSSAGTMDKDERRGLSNRYDKVDPPVRPYAMMTRTGYMEYDPMNSRGLILGIYARIIGPAIGNTVFLQDIKHNQIQVAIERTATEMYFTHGWSRLRDFYNISAGAWLTLTYITPFVLHLRIRSISRLEIAYPEHNPPTKLMLGKDFRQGVWDAPIPFFVLPKVYSHRLEKTLTPADVESGSLSLLWCGFCQNALPNEEAQLTLVDWLGNVWRKCHLQLDKNPPTACTISGQWNDILKTHRLTAGVVVKFGVTESSNNTTIYFKLSPFLGVRTTLYAPTPGDDKKAFYQSQHYFML